MANSCRRLDSSQDSLLLLISGLDLSLDLVSLLEAHHDIEQNSTISNLWQNGSFPIRASYSATYPYQIEG